MLDRLGVRTIKAFAAVAAFALTSGIAGATQSYEWRNVEIVGGGYVPGIVFNTSEPDLIYARTDIGGAYRWNPSTRRWIPLLDWIGFDEWNLTGVDGLATDPIDPKAAPGQTYPALYTSARVAGVRGIFRSTDAGASWLRINDDRHQFAFTGGAITGDPRVFGRVYIATNGRGIIYGEPRARRGGPH